MVRRPRPLPDGGLPVDGGGLFGGAGSLAVRIVDDAVAQGGEMVGGGEIVGGEGIFGKSGSVNLGRIAPLI